MDLPQEIEAEVRQHALDFMVRGILGADDRVHPLGSDTKVLSTVFEIFTRPLLERIAKRHGFQLEEAGQTIYPDFTLMRSPDDRAKIAVDVKTTYRRPAIGYTLGSYTSFLRNNTKNIQYPYDQYASHWIIGFVYTRSDATARDSYAIEERARLEVPYKNVAWFVQEKYKISGETPGSGNTTNIGSIKSTDIEDFRAGCGPFAAHGEDVFRRYWASYPTKAAARTYSTVAEFLAIK